MNTTGVCLGCFPLHPPPAPLRQRRGPGRLARGHLYPPWGFGQGTGPSLQASLAVAAPRPQGMLGLPVTGQEAWLGGGGWGEFGAQSPGPRLEPSPGSWQQEAPSAAPTLNPTLEKSPLLADRKGKSQDCVTQAPITCLEIKHAG